jgi:hypothetical protein
MEPVAGWLKAGVDDGRRWRDWGRRGVWVF